MTRAAEDADKLAMSPLLKDRLYTQRSVFSPGHRLRMNILPMFLNIFVPWGVFIFVLGLRSFWVFYTQPGLGAFGFILAICFWLVSVLAAYGARRNYPEPTWFTYFAIMCGVGIFAA